MQEITGPSKASCRLVWSHPYFFLVGGQLDRGDIKLDLRTEVRGECEDYYGNRQ
jgi:hypothetical protein